MQEQLLAFVEILSDLCHVHIGHLELLGSEVLGLVVQVGGFGDDSVAPAQSPIQEDLRLTLTILCGHLLDDGLLSQVVSLRPHFTSEPAQRTVGDWLDFEVDEELD